MFYKIAQLILTTGRKSNFTSDIFMSQPDTAQEANLGKIFILAEINENSQQAVKLINFIFNEIDKNFYHNEKIILAEKIIIIKPEHIFEAALSKTNINLAKFIEEEKIKINFYDINLTACLVYEKNIYFANTGKNKVLFIYKQKIKTKNKNLYRKNKKELAETKVYEYKITDVTKQTQDNINLEEKKLFSSVVSGRLLDDSVFFFTNEALPEYISFNQIVEITTSLPPLGAVEQLKLILAGINSYVPFLGVIIKSTVLEKQDEPKKYIIKSAQQSIAALNQTENFTENILSPSGLINFKKWFTLPIFKNKTTKEKNNLSISLKEKIFFKKKPFAVFNCLKILKNGKDILSHLIKALLTFIKTLINRDQLQKKLTDIFILFSAKIKGQINFFRHLNFKNRILLILSIAFLTIFTAGLIIQKTNQKQKAKEQAIKDMSSLIEQKQNQVEANLLYNNEEGAKKLFAEIQDLIEKYPQENEKQREQYKEFVEKLNQQREKLKKIATIEDLNVVTDLKNFLEMAKPESIYLDATTEQIYAADASQKTIYILNLKNKQISSLTDLVIETDKLDNPETNDKNFLFYTDGKNLIRFDIKNKDIKNIKLFGVDNNFSCDTIAFYNNNLYAVDTAINQIYKLAKNGETFGPPSKWLKDSTDIKNAVDMAIDGNLYILKDNGELIKLLRGKKINFSLDNVDPPLVKPTRIYLKENLNFIYILEPINQRLLVFDKNGQFILQYKSDIFDDLKSFTLDEKNKLIYLLNGTKIFSFKMTNF